MCVMYDNRILPTFEQAGRFATMVGVHTAEDWAKYTEGLTRQDLFEKVLTVTNQRVMQIALEGE